MENLISIEYSVVTGGLGLTSRHRKFIKLKFQCYSMINLINVSKTLIQMTLKEGDFRSTSCDTGTLEAQ